MKLVFKIALSFAALLLFGTVGLFAQLGPVGFVNCNDGINGITGGMGGKVVRVTNRADLATYAKSNEPYTIIVDGKFEGTGLNRSKDVISVASNKTIVGVKGAELAGIGLDVKNQQNIIIRNLIIHHADPDAIACRNSHHIWVDHCEVYSQDEADKEDWDGLIDLTNGSSYLTVSYCYVHDHHKACLLNSGTMHYEDNGKNRATYHHNAFIGIDQRCPRIGYGLGHVFNNYYQNIGFYAIGIHTQARVVSANNYFGQSVAHPFCQMYASSKDDASCGFLSDSGSHFTKANSTEFKYRPLGTDFNPDEWYDSKFLVDSASAIATLYPDKVGPVEGLEHEPILWPGNGTSGVGTGITLRFSEIEGMTGAEVYFGTSESTMQKVDATTLALQPATTYFWRVRALTADTAYLSPVYRFTTAPEKAFMPTPRSGETNAQLRAGTSEKAKTTPMTLLWRGAFDAASYDVYLATSADDIDSHLVGTTPTTSFNPGTLLYGQTYYWRVDTHTKDGSVVKGDTWTFSAPARYIHVGRTEMEHLARSAYAYLEYTNGSWYSAFNDSVTVGEAGPGAMTGIWDGDDGDYTLKVRFFDETSGQAWMGISVNDKLVDSWTGTKTGKMLIHSMEKAVSLKKGDQIRVDFYTQNKMRCRIDCLYAVASTTGISEINAGEADGSAPIIYDLSGRRLDRITQPGVYIINNKKVVFNGKY